MKKLNALFGTLAVLLAGTGVANAAGSTSATMHVHGTILSDTCTFLFPTTVSGLNVNTTDYSTATVGGKIGEAVNLGNITANGCNTKTVTLKAQSNAQITGDAAKGKFTYTNKPADAKDPLSFTVGYGAVGGATTGGVLKLDGSATEAFTPNSDNFNIPVTLNVLKQEQVDNIGAYAGDFTATVTYTADFS